MSEDLHAGCTPLTEARALYRMLATGSTVEAVQRYELQIRMEPDWPFLSWMVHVTANSASRKSAEAATEAALAAKKSADIGAALHRPFMSLSGVVLKHGWGSRYWDIAFSLKNYGTLPALHVGAMFDLITDNERRGQKTEPQSVEIFPPQEFESIIRFDMGVQDQQAVHAETKKLKIEVRIFYQGDGGRHFEHAAQVSYEHSRFVIDNAETRGS